MIETLDTKESKMIAIVSAMGWWMGGDDVNTQKKNNGGEK